MPEIKKPHAKKIELIKELAEKIKNAKTLMIVSIKGLPSPQFQEIKKSLREHALVMVAKKNIMLRTIKDIGKESILKLEKHIQENCAFAISDLDGFELAGILSQKQSLINAKAGQISPEDIEIKAGPTNLLPGPAISELGALGIQIAVEDGKISIKQPRVVVRKDGEISEAVASLLQKLNIKPFKIGLTPLVIYDVKEEKVYTNIKINSEETAEQLRNVAGKSLGFAQKIVYYCKQTIDYLLAKADARANKLASFEPQETKQEEPEKPAEETTDNDNKNISNENESEVKQEVVDDKPEEPTTDNDNKNETKGEK